MKYLVIYAILSTLTDGEGNDVLALQSTLASMTIALLIVVYPSGGTRKALSREMPLIKEHLIMDAILCAPRDAEGNCLLTLQPRLRALQILLYSFGGKRKLY